MIKTAIGIDLGGTNVKGVLMDITGKVLAQHSLPTKDDVEGLWKQVPFEMVQHLKKLNNNNVDCIGMSAPGLANDTNDYIAHLPHRLPGLEKFNWSEIFGQKTKVINDAHAAIMAEAKYGALIDIKHAALLTLGTGVGGGILINGELYQGLSQMAGHLGHMTINANDDELSIIGTPGSLEYAIGNFSIERRSMGKFKTTKELLIAYKHGDKFATWLWLDSIRKLAIFMSSLINALSPEAIVLAGGITRSGNDLFAPLTQFLNMYEFSPQGKKTRLLPAHFTDLSGAVGAAAFAFSKMNE